MNWVKLSDGNYVNLDHCLSMYGSGSGSTFYLNVQLDDSTSHQINGVWATGAAAQEAARRIVHGVDPGTF